VTDWIETWPRREMDAQNALVMVFDSERQPCGVQSSLVSSLQRLAEDRGLDFFCNYDHPKPFEFIQQRARPAREFRMSVDSCRPSFENWGIND